MGVVMENVWFMMVELGMGIQFILFLMEVLGCWDEIVWLLWVLDDFEFMVVYWFGYLLLEQRCFVIDWLSSQCKFVLQYVFCEDCDILQQGWDELFCQCVLFEVLFFGDVRDFVQIVECGVFDFGVVCCEVGGVQWVVLCVFGVVLVEYVVEVGVDGVDCVCDFVDGGDCDWVIVVVCDDVFVFVGLWDGDWLVFCFDLVFCCCCCDFFVFYGFVCEVGRDCEVCVDVDYL